MQLVPINDWHTRERVRVGSGRLFGVAIGPDSHEARCYVDGVLVQAGRVVPIRAQDGYTVERANGLQRASDSISETSLQDTKFLQLALFECPEELACEVARPNHEFYSRAELEVESPGTGEGDQGVEGIVLVVPFSGRSQAQVRMWRTGVDGGAGKWGYRIVGMKYSNALRTMKLTTLVTVTGLDTEEEAHIIGGGSEAEDYQQLVVYITAEDGVDGAATTQTFHCDATCIGEIGRSGG